jgi:hypothetical protein
MSVKQKLKRDQEFQVVTTRFALAPPVHAFESLATALRQIVCAGARASEHEAVAQV